MFEKILAAFGLPPDNYTIEPFGSGLINHTYIVSGKGERFILQQMNKHVFKNPQNIAYNLSLIESYLKQLSPGYLFVAPVTSKQGEGLVLHGEHHYRLTPFIENSHTINFVSNSKQACEAASQFGKFTRLLSAFDVQLLRYTLPYFHNLTLRAQQYKQAFLNADGRLLKQAAAAVKEIERHVAIAEEHARITKSKTIPLRVIHHDTKINNILFDHNNNGLCVIDLDTVMPGYYISDVGDMMRTYLSEANEEEQDLKRINIREHIFLEIYNGYMQQMGDVLTIAEKSLFFYSGQFIIYMQAMRFLTDFLNGDKYYHTTYPAHNLIRAQNQLTLLNQYTALKFSFKELIKN